MKNLPCPSGCGNDIDPRVTGVHEDSGHYFCVRCDQWWTVKSRRIDASIRMTDMECSTEVHRAFGVNDNFLEDPWFIEGRAAAKWALEFSADNVGRPVPFRIGGMRITEIEAEVEMTVNATAQMFVELPLGHLDAEEDLRQYLEATSGAELVEIHEVISVR